MVNDEIASTKFTLDEIIQGKGEVLMLGERYEFKKIFLPIECGDGTTISVQASRLHYSFPRDGHGPYAAVEVGLLDVDPPNTWAEYADGDFPSSVYGYVPIELVREYIDSHGGEKRTAAEDVNGKIANS